MTPTQEAEEAIAALAMFLTKYGPQSPDVHRIAKAVEPIAAWHQEYIEWRTKCRREELRRLMTGLR
jgi:hypothetical protein